MYIGNAQKCVTSFKTCREYLYNLEPVYQMLRHIDIVN